MKNNQNSGAVVRRLLRTIREFYPVMLPLTLVCIVVNAVVSSLPSIFMQNIIAIVDVESSQHLNDIIERVRRYDNILSTRTRLILKEHFGEA